MSDDPSRPLPGSQSDPTPAAGAPAWWGSLERGDLPLDGGEPTPRPRPRPRQVPSPPAPPRLAGPQRPARSGGRWRTVAFNAAVLLTALLIACVGVGVISPAMFLTVALLFGVPLILAAGTAAIVARRSR